VITDYRAVNHCATADFNVQERINLHAIREGRLHRKRPKARIVKFADCGTALIYQSGKAVIMGPRPEQVVVKCIQLLTDAGYVPSPIPYFRETNTIICGNVGSFVDLRALQRADPCRVFYEPELHNSAVVRLGDGRAKLVMFSSGRFHLTGAVYYSGVEQMLQQLLATMHT
jgi:TATA-box binding protein (TBP) (component of TFIID and TFIIIB)